MSSIPSSTALNRLFWRIHFWAGLISSPIILFASITGFVYVFTPQIEAWRHAEVDTVAVGTARLPLDAQVAAAQAAAPDAALRYVVPAYGATDSTQVWLRAPHEHHSASKGEHDHGLPTGSIVYVNPYTGQVLGQLQEMERFKTWAKKLHSTALQGKSWRWLIELGACWMLVLFATGLTMWWPKSQATGGQGWRALLPRWGRGRATWRDLHASVAIALGLVMAIVLVTGLTWAEHSGKRFRDLQAATGQDTPKAPKSLKSAPGDGPHLSWQAAHDAALRQAPDIALQITPPTGKDGVWRVENFDRSQPEGRFNLALDARSGSTLFASGWQQYPMLSKATAVGIPFHRGEFGVWNQVLLALAALAGVFSVVSGLVMWWQRRPRGKLAAPSLPNRHVAQAPLWLWPLMAAMAWALPVFGWSLLAFLGLEALTRLAIAVRRRTAA
jgi:uncharacterized iron-regulated membrane protein